MVITAEQVRQLRARTGAGVMDCKKALQECQGDLERAASYLRKEGISKAEQRQTRVAAEGRVSSYIHGKGKIGVLVEVNCETDFVAQTDEFQAFCKDLAMHVAAEDPKFLRREEVPEAVLAEEREIYRAQALKEGKPEKVVDRIVEGRLEKFFQQTCLLEQPFVRDPDRTVGQLLQETRARLGENIIIRRFVRFRLGEDLE